MYSPEDFEVVISNGSSADLIRLKLQSLHPTELGNTIEFLVTENFRVYIHHTHSHKILQRDTPSARGGIIALGNLSLDPRIPSEMMMRSKNIGYQDPEKERKIMDAARTATKTFLRELLAKPPDQMELWEKKK